MAQKLHIDIGGYLRNGRRKPENVVNRQLLTLDIDFAHKDFWDDYLLQFSNLHLSIWEGC